MGGAASRSAERRQGLFPSSLSLRSPCYLLPGIYLFMLFPFLASTALFPVWFQLPGFSLVPASPTSNSDDVVILPFMFFFRTFLSAFLACLSWLLLCFLPFPFSLFVSSFCLSTYCSYSSCTLVFASDIKGLSIQAFCFAFENTDWTGLQQSALSVTQTGT